MYGTKLKRWGVQKRKENGVFVCDAVETTSVGSHAYAVGVGASNFQLFIKFLFLLTLIFELFK